MYLHSSVPDNAWTHLAITWDQPTGRMTMFINGVEKDKTSLQVNLSQLTPLDCSVGWRSYRKNMVFKGLMRDLQIFDKSLNLAELQAIKGKMYINLKRSACLPYMWCLSRALLSKSNPGLLLFPLTRSVIVAKTRTNHRRNAYVNLGSGIGTRPKRWGVEWEVGGSSFTSAQYVLP